MRLRYGTALLLATLVPSSFFAVGEPASAHAQLLVANPGISQTLNAMPGLVKLQFDDDLIDMPSGNQIAVLDTAGKHMETGVTKLDGATLSVLLAKFSGVGKFQVLYRAISADGHPVSGGYYFYVAKPSPSPSPSKVTSSKVTVKVPPKKSLKTKK
jgi:methionine-rich copper-binding protein CopC